MFYLVPNRNILPSSFFSLTHEFRLCCFLSQRVTSRSQHASDQTAPKTFASPEEAGKALADAAKSQSQDAILAIFGSGIGGYRLLRQCREDKASLDGFAQGIPGHEPLAETERQQRIVVGGR